MNKKGKAIGIFVAIVCTLAVFFFVAYLSPPENVEKDIWKPNQYEIINKKTGEQYIPFKEVFLKQSIEIVDSSSSNDTTIIIDNNIVYYNSEKIFKRISLDDFRKFFGEALIVFEDDGKIYYFNEEEYEISYALQDNEEYYVFRSKNPRVDKVTEESVNLCYLQHLEPIEFIVILVVLVISWYASYLIAKSTEDKKTPRE